MKCFLVISGLMLMGLISLNRLYIVNYIFDKTTLEFSDLDPDGNPTDHDIAVIPVDQSLQVNYYEILQLGIRYAQLYLDEQKEFIVPIVTDGFSLSLVKPPSIL